MSRFFDILFVAAAIFVAAACSGVRHTYYSQFSRADSLQVAEIFSPEGVEFKTVGHHGPAVENQYMALRLYFDARGAIDVYNKSGKIDNELGRWRWYPSPDEQEKEGAGCDEYFVGQTSGLGGVRLWDGQQEVRLNTTAGRRSIVGRTQKGAYMEMISYGVVYQEDTVDVSVLVEVWEDSRWANVTVRELSGKPLRFATGVNYHPGAQIRSGEGWIAVWGEHPADVSGHPAPIGCALRYSPQQFPSSEDTGTAIRLISLPISSFSTQIMAASVKEDGLNTPERFFEFVLSATAAQYR